MAKFTDAYLDSLQVPAGKRDLLVFDDEQPGFYCRLYVSGVRSFGVQYDYGAKTRRITLGRVITGKGSNVKTMRTLASQTLARVRLGTDVVQEKRAAIEAAEPVTTMGDLVPTYLAERKLAMKPRSYAEVARHLEKKAEKLHGKGVAEIGRDLVVELLDDIQAKSGAVAADRTRSSLSSFFGWSIDRGHIEANPCLGIKDRAASNGGRDRALTLDELKAVWLATAGRHDHDRIARLLILTGQRRQEIGALAWSEVNMEARQIELPAARTKNRRPHIVPLSKPALAILASVTRRDDSPYVFGRLDTPFSGWSRCKDRLDKRINEDREPLPAWTLHDLRRTFSTQLREQRIGDPHLIELIINHVSGTRGGVAGVYDRSERLEERRKALEDWGALVARLGKARGK